MPYLKRINSLPLINHISYKYAQVSHIVPSWSSCYWIWNSRLQTLSVWKSLKVVVWERVKLSLSRSFWCLVHLHHSSYAQVHKVADSRGRKNTLSPVWSWPKLSTRLTHIYVVLGTLKVKCCEKRRKCNPLWNLWNYYEILYQIKLKSFADIFQMRFPVCFRL